MSIKILKSGLISILLLVALAVPVWHVAHVAAIDQAAQEAACAGIGAVGGSCTDGSADNSIDDIIATVVNILSWVVGVVAVIMIIIGGFRYVVSAGDSNAISSAKNTIMYALIGIVVVALAQIIVRYILKLVV